MKLKKLSIYTKLLLVFCLLFSIFIISTYPLSPPVADEGMHLTLSLFYYDLTHHVIDNGFSNVYDYTINYLVHYPKLTVGYPPLYHFIISLAFNLFISVLTAKIITLIFSLGCIVVTYKLAVFLTKDRRVALLTSVLLGLSPLFVVFSRTLYMTIPLLFFALLTFYVYLKAFEKKSMKLFLLAGFLLALAFLLKWMCLIILPVIFLYWLFTKRDLNNFKKFLVSLAFTALILCPYFYLYNSLNLTELCLKVVWTAGLEQMHPQFTSLAGWLYYPQRLIEQLTIPLAVLSILAANFYVYNKEKNWKLLGIWILVVYLTFTFIPTKGIRYTTFYLPALLMPLSFYLVKKIDKNKLWTILIAALIILEVFTAYTMIPKFSTNYEEITTHVYDNTKGNIAFISESEKMQASVFIFHMLKLDRNLTLSISRPCIFCDKSSEEIDKIIRENNIYYLIYVPDTQNIDNFQNIELEREYENFQLYRVKGFEYLEKDFVCNYICRLEGWLCNNMSFEDIFLGVGN